MLPNAVPRPFRAMNAFNSAASFGLFLRMATARVPPVRTATASCTVSSVKTFFQNSAR